MSFKTLGKDSGKSVWPTLRHAAGREKYRNETILKEIEKRNAKRVSPPRAISKSADKVRRYRVGRMKVDSAKG